MATENLKFKIQLYATFWNKLPTCEIFIDDKSHWKGEIAGTEQEPITVEFESVLEQNKEYKLSIHRQGKDKGQTVVNDKGEKFEFCMFLKQSHEQSVDAYYFLVELRDSVEKAIRTTLIREKEESNESDD